MIWLCKNCETNNNDDLITCSVCDEKSPEILVFKSSSTKIEMDTPITLEWDVRNVDSILIDTLGTLKPKGKKKIYIEEAMEMRLVAKNEVYTRVQSIFFEFLPPEILSFSASKKLISPGEEIELVWEAKNFDKVSILKIGDVTRKRNVKVSPNKSTEYVLVASNKGGEISEKVYLELPKPNIHSFKADKPVVIEGKSNNLSWKVDFAEYIRISPDIGDVTHLKESRLKVSPIAPITYVMVAGNDMGSVKKSIFLDTPKLDILSFAADHSRVLPFGEVVLNWETNYAKHIDINKGVGLVGKKGTALVKVGDRDMEFTLTVEGEYGLVKKEKLVVRVFEISYLRPERDLLDSSKIKLTWLCEGAHKLMLNNGIGDVTGYNAVEIPSSDKSINYELTAFLNEEEFVKKRINLTPAVLDKFTVSSKYVFEGKLIELEWSVANSIRVFINNGIGKVKPIGSKKIVVGKEFRYFEIIVFGETNTIKKKIDLQYVKVPELTILKIPQPAINVKYDFKKVKANFSALDENPMQLKRNFIWTNFKLKFSSFSMPNLGFKKKKKDLVHISQDWTKLKKELLKKLKEHKS